MATYSGTPRTWVSGETVTAALLNSDVRDPLAALAGSWNSYTPTLTGFTPGNGTAAGSYIQVGKFVVFRAQFTFGSTSAAAAAAPTLTLPVSSNGTATTMNAAVQFGDASAGTIYQGVTYQSASSTISAYVHGTNGLAGVPSTTSPFTWTTSDVIVFRGLYEAALSAASQVVQYR